MNGPLLIAHRGDPAHAPENTLASFKSALRRKAKAIEMDVRRRSDGTWIVFHDRFKHPPLHAAGSREPVPTVMQALAFCRSRRTCVFLDVKEPAGEKELLLLIRRSGWLGSTSILASTLVSLRRWRRLLPPGHPLLWVTGYRAPLTPRRVSLATSVPVQGVVAYRRWVTSSSVCRVHSAGLKILVWTAQTAAQVRQYAALGADGIMSEAWPPPSI